MSEPRLYPADGVDTALVSASVGMGIDGAGLLCTIIAAPIVLGLELASLASLDL